MPCIENSPLTVLHLNTADVKRAAEVMHLSKTLRHMPVDEDFLEELLDEGRMMQVELTRTDATLLKACDTKNDILGIASYHQKGSFIHMTRMYTIPSGKKPGGALMTFMLNDATKRGVRRIFGTATDDNAIGFYRHYGFSLIRPDEKYMEKWMPITL